MNDIWSILILFLIVQGIFILTVLWFLPKRRKKTENQYLFFIILVFLWFLFEFYCVRNRIRIPLNAFYGTRYGSWMILGPLTFFFFRSITTPEWRMHRRDVLHFVPFLLSCIVVPILSQESLSNRQIHYGMLAVFDHRPKTVTPFEYAYSTLFYLQFVHLGVYLVINYFQLRTYTRNVQKEYAQLNNIIWLKLFNSLFFLSLILASVYLYILFASAIYTRNLDYIYVVPMGLFLYAISYKLSGIEWLKVTETSLRYSSSTLTQENKDRIQQKLQELMKTEKPYLINELRLKDLAQRMSCTTHHLSQVINETSGYSFFDFINSFRVIEAKLIIGQNPEYTLLKVAFEAGFNNKTSFVNAFKKFEGQTPSTYRKKLLRKTG